VRALGLLSLLLYCCATAGAARAEEQRARLSTYLRAFPRPGVDEPRESLQLYELLRLHSRDVGWRGVSVQADLWGRIELLDLDIGREDEGRARGDVSVLLVEYRAPYKSRLEGLRLRLGRQFVAAGPSLVEQLDGGMASYRLPFGLELTAFGGLCTGLRFFEQPWPVGTDDSRFGGNWVVGGRVGYRFGDLAAVGVSYRHKRYDAELAHEEVGWDATASPLSWLDLIGHGAVELVTLRLKELRAGVRAHPWRRLAAGLGYRFVSPDLFIPRTSIFAVFADDPRQEVYAEADWRPRRWLRLFAEGAARVYSESCTYNDIDGGVCEDSGLVTASALLRADLWLGSARRFRLTFEAQRVGAPERGFTRLRAAARLPLIHRLTASADVDFFVLDRDEGTSTLAAAGKAAASVSGSAFLAYPLRDDLRLLAGGNVLATPLFKSAGALLVRLDWLIDVPARPAARVRISRSTTALSLGSVRRSGW